MSPPTELVDVTELRRNLPSYLARVAKGGRLRVTSRGRVIAEITPSAANADNVAAVRKRLQGSVRTYEAPLDPAIAPEEWDMTR
jgi:prevent-host-death family protein